MKKIVHITTFVQLLFLWIDLKIILNNYKLQKSDLFFFCVVAPVCIGVSIMSNQIVLVSLTMILVFLFLYLSTHSIRTSIVVEAIFYMISITTDHLDVIILQTFFNGYKEIIYISTFIVTQLIFCVVLFLLMKVVVDHKKTTNEFNYSNFEVAFSLFSLVIYLYLIVFVEILQGNQTVALAYNALIVFLMTIVLLISHFARVQVMKDKYEIEAKEARIKSNNQYIHEVERHYNELRTFRHNYQNVLLSLDEYLKTDDIKGLKKYYQNSLKPISLRLNQKKYVLEDLSKIDNKEIKSIIFNKLYSAQLSDIDVFFESKSEIVDLYTDTLDLTLALGIILDNAIDETKEQKHGWIQVGIILEDPEISIIVQNSLRQSDVPVWKMKKINFSTKGTGRGVGLNNLEEIINRNSNLILETMKMDEVFLQKITIEMGDSNND